MHGKNEKIHTKRKQACSKIPMLYNWAENEMVGCHHWLNGQELEQTPGDSGGQRNWHSAVHGVIKVRYNLAAKQQQQYSDETRHVRGVCP